MATPMIRISQLCDEDKRKIARMIEQLALITAENERLEQLAVNSRDDETEKWNARCQELEQLVTQEQDKYARLERTVSDMTQRHSELQQAYDTVQTKYKRALLLIQSYQNQVLKQKDAAEKQDTVAQTTGPTGVHASKPPAITVKPENNNGNPAVGQTETSASAVETIKDEKVSASASVENEDNNRNLPKTGGPQEQTVPVVDTAREANDNPSTEPTVAADDKSSTSQPKHSQSTQSEEKHTLVPTNKTEEASTNLHTSSKSSTQSSQTRECSTQTDSVKRRQTVLRVKSVSRNVKLGRQRIAVSADKLRKLQTKVRAHSAASRARGYAHPDDNHHDSSNHQQPQRPPPVPIGFSHPYFEPLPSPTNAEDIRGGGHMRRHQRRRRDRQHQHSHQHSHRHRVPRTSAAPEQWFNYPPRTFPQSVQQQQQQQQPWQANRDNLFPSVRRTVQRDSVSSLFDLVASLEREDVENRPREFGNNVQQQQQQQQQQFKVERRQTKRRSPPLSPPRDVEFVQSDSTTSVDEVDMLSDSTADVEDDHLLDDQSGDSSDNPYVVDRHDHADAYYQLDDTPARLIRKYLPSRQHRVTEFR